MKRIGRVILSICSAALWSACVDSLPPVNSLPPIDEPFCGDGVALGTEQCDWGSGNTQASCRNCCRKDCTLQRCGDGIVDDVDNANEECDDQNQNTNDGCDATCQLAPYFFCTGTPSVCQCANGYQDKNHDGTCQPSCQGFGDCGGHGSCSDTDGTARCICETEYQDSDSDGRCAETCEQRGYAGCHGGGECVYIGGEAVCLCNTGYQGATCDSCTDGFIPHPLSLKCIADPCLPGPCGAHGTCDNSNGSAVCHCAVGFAGEICDACTDGASSYPYCFLRDCRYELCNALKPTAQTHCHSGTGVALCSNCGTAGSSDCGVIDYCGQDAQYDGTSPAYQCFAANGSAQVDCDTDADNDEVVVDRTTGLMWQRLPDSNYQWQEAITYCNQLSYGSYDDWRLPTYHELRSLVHYGQTPPTIDWSAFTSAFSHSEWTSTPDAASGSNAWYVYFTLGETAVAARTDGKSARCVRLGSVGGTRAVVRYIQSEPEAGKFVFTDPATSLMWAGEDASTTQDWLHALKFCEESTFGGYTDWRLPNLNELASIIDVGRSNPATRLNAMTSNVYWSGTPASLYSNRAWTIHFSTGQINNKDFGIMTGSLNVRCVRAGP